MSLLFKISCLYFFTTVAVHGQAPSCDLTLKGRVYDVETEDPLPLAAIWIDALNKGTVTNEEGYFEIENVCEQEYKIDIHYLGYEEYSETVSVKEDGLMNFPLKEEELFLEGITVKGLVLDNEPIQPKVSLSEEALERSRGMSLGESLEAIAGVTTLQTGPTIAKPVIHGLHSNRILILNNGIRQEGQQWGSDHAPEIDPFVATELSVVKGAESVRYGADAIGGVVLVEPAPLPLHAGTSGEVHLVGMSNSRMGLLSGKVEGGSPKLEGLGWRLQGTAKKAGDAQAADYVLTNTGMEELNFSATAGYHEDDFGGELFYSIFNTSLGILRSAHVGNYEDFIRSIERQEPLYTNDFSYDIGNPRQKITHHLVKASTYRRFDGLGKLKLIYGGQFNHRQEFDIRRGGRSGRPALLMKLLTNTVDVVLEHEPLGRLSGEVGMQGMFQKNRNDVEETGTRPLVPNYRNFSGGIYLIEKMSFKDWELEAGLRYDYRLLNVARRDRQNEVARHEGVFQNLSASLGVLYHFSPIFSFKTNLGTAWRPPNVNELFSEGVHHAIGRIEEGLITKNEQQALEINDFNTEKAVKWVNTFTYNSERLSIETSLYYNYIRNYVYLRPADTRLTIRGFFPVFQYEQTHAAFRGIDAHIHYDLSDNLSYDGKAAIVRAEDKLNKDGELIFIPSDRFENMLGYNLGDWGIFSGLTLAAGVSSVAKQRHAPPALDDYYNIPEDESFDFAPAPGAYNLIDMHLNTAFAIGPNELNIGFSVSNLLNISYREYMNSLRYYADDAGRNFTLRLRYNFGTNHP